MGGSAFSQTINLGGTIVNIDDIPMDKRLISTQNTILKSGGDEYNGIVCLYKSSNSQYFLKATQIDVPETMLKSGEISGVSHKIEMYNAQGGLKWSKDLELPISRCRVANDGSYCHGILEEYGEDFYYSKLVTFDANGNTIISDDNVGNLYPSFNKDIIYYHVHKGGTRVMHGRNLINNTHWEMPVSLSSAVACVSYDGSSVIEVSKNGLVSLTAEGEVKWRNPDLGGRLISLSKNGEYLLIRRAGHLTVYNNNNGDYLTSITAEGVADVERPILGSLVLNNDSLIVTLSGYEIFRKGWLNVCVFNLNGELLAMQDVNSNIVRTSIIGFRNSDHSVSVFFEGVKVATIALNHALYTPLKILYSGVNVAYLKLK